MSNLREILQEIYDEHGKLTPELVREAARPRNSPLHAFVFKLAPKDAAEAWYLQRAHELIRKVRVVYKEASDTEPEVSGRWWHAVRTSDREYVYESVDKIAENPFTRQVVLRDMERQWRALYFRYQGFAEFLELVRGDLIDEGNGREATG